MKPWVLILSLAFMLLASIDAPSAGAADATNTAKTRPARLQIAGYGILGNRELRRMLTTLELAGKRPEFFSASFVEDASLILLSRVKRDGYLRPGIQITLRLADGRVMQVDGAGLLENPLPHPLRIVSARFQIRRGVLYYVKSLEFHGLTAIPVKTARSYFIETGTLISSKRTRAYTPAGIERGLSSVRNALDRLGYQDATAESEVLSQDDRTGGVVVAINVEQGPKYFVHSIRVEFVGGPATNQNHVVTPNHPYSRIWLQDFVLGIKTNLFRLGYPDTTVEIQNEEGAPDQSSTQKDLVAIVKSGPQVRIGTIEFSGAKRVSRRLLRRSVRIQRGDLLDPTRVEEGRSRLARLGIFDGVDLKYQPEDEGTRNVLFSLSEGKRVAVSLLFGWGSYELLRGGVDLEVNDLWGEAHHLEVRAIQSFKASSGDLTYTVPELVGGDIDLFVNGSGLRREEISFTRLEYGGSIGLHKFFKPVSTDVSARYSYQILNASDFSTVQPVSSEGLTNPAVGSISFDLKHDRRDNPLYPHSGYRVFLTLETASHYLGGVANYQRIEILSSWHHSLGGGLYLHLGASQGIVDSFGSASENLPFDKRFFPGGGNSIRGYQEGEASPRNQSGELVGAETYSLASVELEQALTPKWSLVIFSDSLGFAKNLNHYPFDTGLFSVGGGLRWRTLIGPVRLEYGYNLNPRPLDPVGTLQFTLGFPF
jgi:outer membrane protein assembly complex protein YaeT